ncbi:MAG: ribosome small subunit-dependent GTPase A [Bacilli bacterium]|nr:ribosome small subunit-dependent GTPase A [Bacilli bacterium]MBN2877780.1 ribosome small subunit-dependent GTPase A [Bacilli bacterium]
MKQGRIIKLVGGHYTVQDEAKQTYDLKPLGVFRHRNISPKVGDIVDFDENNIVEVHERVNELYRPMIANVDQVLIVTSAKRPNFSFLLLDKFLAMIEAFNIAPVIIVSKIDLMDTKERMDLEQKLDYYKQYFQVIFYSSKTLEGIPEILVATTDKVNVLAGQTGAGKSSLLNAIQPDLDLETDEISNALGRGKHTTRHVEIFEFGHGYIADTPGFSKLEFIDFQADQLRFYYPDFFAKSSSCKFYECTHTHEPGCEIKRLVSTGEIPEFRYDNYVSMYHEILQIKPKYRRDDK